jgi:hypothetical protein
MYQEKKDLIYTAAEAWNHACLLPIGYSMNVPLQSHSPAWYTALYLYRPIQIFWENSSIIPFVPSDKPFIS